MRRDTFLKGFVGTLAALRRGTLPLAEATPAGPATIAAAPVQGGTSLVASGGLCAPLTPIYYVSPTYMDSIKWVPVRDALPSFKAERGGVEF